MARVSTREQFDRYELLRDILVARHSIYSCLDSQEQAALYAFYQPHKDHRPDSLKAHQQAAAKTSLSLPHRAGKAFHALLDAATAIVRAEAERPIGPAHQGHVNGPRRKRNIVARPVVRPEPDLQKLALAVIQLAEQMTKDAKDKTKAA